MRQSLLEVSEIVQHIMRNAVRPQLPGVHLSPLARGKTLRLRTSVFQIQANSVFQQSEANLAWGSESRMKGITAGRGLVRGNSERGEDATVAAVYRYRTSASNNATAGIFRARLGHESPQLSRLQAGGAIHATQSRGRV